MRAPLFPYSYTVQLEKFTELIQMIGTTSKTSHFLSQKNQQETKSEQRNFWRPNLLRQANLFTIPQFLKSEFCTQLRAEVRQSLSQPAQVVGKDNQPKVDQTIRRTDEGQISPHSRKAIKNRLIKLKPQLEQYFKTNLSEMEGPRVLRYYQGYFFTWHTDRSNYHSITKSRKVTSLVYLNEPNKKSESDSFIGGELERYIHDLIPQEEYRKYCLQLSHETGILTALIHRYIIKYRPYKMGNVMLY